MTHKEMIKKYRLELVDGGMQATGKMSASAIKMLKAAKPKLMIILKEMEVKKERWLRKEKQRKKATIAAQKSSRQWALVKSGHYLMDCHVEYVVLLTDAEKTKYRADFAKNNLYKLAIDNQQTDLAPIEKKSTIIKTIKDRKREGYLGYGESVVWLITNEEKNMLLKEIKQHAEEIAKEKAAKQNKKAEEIKVLRAQAQKTGKPIVMYSYVTSECMNGGHDCSFDSATVYMLPDGTQKTTYTCCH